MNTQPQYIQIALLVGLGLLVLIVGIGSYMLYTIEYDEPTSTQTTNVPGEQNTPSQNQVVPTPTDGTMPVVQEVVNVPPPAPTLEDIKAAQTAREAELKNTEQDGLYSDVQRMATPEQRIQDSPY